MLYTIGAFVRQRRQALGKTQRQIAQACGVTPEMIQMIEADRRRPDPEWTGRLADALETDRTRFCQMALKNWYPCFYADVMGSALPTDTNPRTESESPHRVTVELSREEVDWLRSLNSLDMHARLNLLRLPFHITYGLNGHSFIEQELNRQGVAFRKKDNAFLAPPCKMGEDAVRWKPSMRNSAEAPTKSS